MCNFGRIKQKQGATTLHWKTGQTLLLPYCFAPLTWNSISDEAKAKRFTKVFLFTFYDA